MPITSIQAWLNHLGMSQYADAFETNDIELELLAHIDDQALKDIGVTSVGHRVKLLKAVADFRTGQASVSFSAQIDEVPASLPIMRTGGERRQVTVLFCDMVGFTELANRLDPEVLQGIIRYYEEVCSACITRYEGYVFQRLGDGIVAFFGYPRAHEGEAERATHAGLSIIDSLSNSDVSGIGRIQVRIGVATGVVVISDPSEGAVGDTMNLASRLQSVAPVGSLVVSERVRRLAGGIFEYDDLGEQMLKGIAKPTRVYRVAAVSQVASRFEATTQEELAQDGKGQVVLLSGEPGIGKSRVMSKLYDWLKIDGTQALRFQASPYHLNSAYYPMLEHFERVLKFERDESPESKLDKLGALMVGLHGLSRREVRFVAAMLSIPCEARYGAISITP